MKSKVAMLCLVTLSCPTLCNLMDCSPPGLSVHGDSPGKSTEVGSIPPPGHLPNPGIESKSPALKVNSLSSEPPGKPKNTAVGSWSLLQGIFSTQELNQGLLLYMRILYQLNYQGSPKLKVVSYQKYNKENASLEFPPAESSFSIDHDLAPFVNLFDPEELFLEVLMNEMHMFIERAGVLTNIYYSNPEITVLTTLLQDAYFWNNNGSIQEKKKVFSADWASQVVLLVKNPPANAGNIRLEHKGWSLGWEDPLEEDMATQSSILAWRIPWIVESWQATVHQVAKNWTQSGRQAPMVARTAGTGRMAGEPRLCSWSVHLC